MAIFDEKIEIIERCKGVHCVDLSESFPTRIYLQKSASIQPRTSPSKFGGKIQFTIHFTPYLQLLAVLEQATQRERVALPRGRQDALFGGLGPLLGYHGRPRAWLVEDL